MNSYHTCPEGLIFTRGSSSLCLLSFCINQYAQLLCFLWLLSAKSLTVLIPLGAIGNVRVASSPLANTLIVFLDEDIIGILTLVRTLQWPIFYCRIMGLCPI